MHTHSHTYRQVNPGPPHCEVTDLTSRLESLTSLFLPLIVSSRQRWAGGRLPADLILLLHHAVAERNEVALQDDQALAQALGRQSAFGHLNRELLLIVDQDHQTILQLSLI